MGTENQTVANRRNSKNNESTKPYSRITATAPAENGAWPHTQPAETERTPDPKWVWICE